MHSVKRLKVLWLSHFVPYPPKGGMLLRSYNLLREAAKYHDIDLFSFIQRKPLETMFPTVEEGLAEARQHLQTFCNHVEFFSIPCETIAYGNHLLALKSLFTKAPYTINWLKSAYFQHRVTEAFRQKKYDAIHFDTISFAYLKDIFETTPCVLNHHNIESHMLLRRASLESNFLKGLYFKLEGIKLERYERAFCPRFTLNVVCSDLDKERLHQIATGTRIESVPNGVDIEYFNPLQNTLQKKNSLVFAGGLNWYPNTAAMVFFAEKIWPLLKQRIPDIEMNVIGQDPPESLLALAKHDDGFKVHGFVNDVRPFIDSATVYVCPIKDGGGTKLKILDALAMGKALVADAVACEGIEVANGENVVFAQSPDEYVNAIVMLLGDNAMRTRLGISGRKLVCDRYSYRELGLRLARLFAETKEA